MWIAKPSKAHCINCGKRVQKTGNNVKWCSNKCRDRYKRVQNGGMAIPLKISCALCEKTIDNPRASNQRFCSKLCSMRAFQQERRKAKLKVGLRQKKERQERDVVNVIDEYLRLEEAAGNLRLSTRSLFRLIAQKKLRARKFNGRTIIHREDLIALFTNQS